MNAIENILNPADMKADTDAVMDSIATGKRLDPVIARRIRDRAELIRQEILEKHGLLDIGVPAIRELRDGDEA
jgi:hypothetical protein